MILAASGQDREREIPEAPRILPYVSGTSGRYHKENLVPVLYKDRRDFLHLKMHSAVCSGKNILHPSQ